MSTVLAAICLGATAVAGAAGEEIALEEKVNRPDENRLKEMTVHSFGNPSASIVLFQAIDEHSLSSTENEIPAP